MAAISLLNPQAEYVRSAQALSLNISAAKGLQEVMRTNLGPHGTMKMLVTGAGDIKITKDGNVLLHDMQIQHPTASLIARTSTAMDDITGDGTTSTVLFIAELLKQADLYISEGVHPRAITEGFKEARVKAQQVLETLKIPMKADETSLTQVAWTSLNTKVPQEFVDNLSQVCVNAVLSVRKEGAPIDLHMIELMTMKNKLEAETVLVKGLVLDHGSRHPNMPKKVKNAYILTCNVSLEYEKSEVNSGFFYKSAEEREKLVASEREFIDQRVKKIIELKKQLCPSTDKGFVVINQKGIDPVSLDMLAREGIMALRRAKRRNMERLTEACGGTAVNCFDDLDESCLGHADLVYEHVLGETKYTYVMKDAGAASCTVLVHGPTSYAIKQISDAIRDGLRAVKNAIDDGACIPGAGASELAVRQELLKFADTIQKNHRIGVKTFAEALLVIPKVLAINSGHDPQEAISALEYEIKSSGSNNIGLDIDTGKPIDAAQRGIFDNYCVKRQFLSSSVVIASNLLLVDEVMRAGMSSLSG